MDSFLLIGGTHRMIQFGHLMNRNAFPIFTILSPHITSLSFVCLSHLVITASHSIPHPRVFRPRKNSSAIVIKSIIVHVLQFVSLSQTVPSPKIFRINLNCISIGLYGSWNIFHLKILMSHQSPGSQACSV